MASLENYKLALSGMKTLLKKEIKLLRSGRYREIENFREEKLEKSKKLANLVELLNSGQMADMQEKQYIMRLTADIAEIKTLSLESASLLQGAMAGVRSAQKRLFALQNRNMEVGVYGRAGRPLAFEELASQKEKSF